MRLLFALLISLFILAYSASFPDCTMQTNMTSITDLMSTQVSTPIQVRKCNTILYLGRRRN